MRFSLFSGIKGDFISRDARLSWGNFDENQDESYKMTAIRETFEETGLLLASSTSKTPLNDAVLDASRKSIHTGKTSFGDFLTQHALTADVNALLPFTEWTTPVGPPRRFRTRFFVAFLPFLCASSFSSGAMQHRLPTPDGGQEVIEARFVHPREALTEHRAHKIILMPPQHYILSTLADILVGPGAFGRMNFHPRAGQKDANGQTPLVYEGDEARGGPEGSLHRSLVLFDPDTKMPTEVTLLRNLDIFSEVEAIASAKL
ncbi:hypothetical protein B0F90DRAFT_1814330 [Multifurca ochricompacta]|uniref:Nudix hydrolase domain-containing protein n=1 Tax=Multifurca ochricompacta TaxID=376703 RepID=A0AAD4MAS0_9AGAM|nr:hypothetical protein B0F90DRAFT_1814330 [Multifurca ochricompacta]